MTCCGGPLVGMPWSMSPGLHNQHDGSDTCMHARLLPAGRLEPKFSYPTVNGSTTPHVLVEGSQEAKRVCTSAE